MAEKYNIHSVSDLKKPGIAKLFDVNGDGRGDYWPGAPGWGVPNIYQVNAKSYGLTKYYDSFIVPDALLKPQLKKDTPPTRASSFTTGNTKHYYNNTTWSQ